MARRPQPRFEIVIFDRADYQRYGAELAHVEWRALELTRERAERLAAGYRRNIATRGAYSGRGQKIVIVRPLASSRDRRRRDLPESIGHHGYTPPRQLSERERLRLIAERRRRYHQQTQTQESQGPGYDQRQPRRRRRRARRRR